MRTTASSRSRTAVTRTALTAFAAIASALGIAACGSSPPSGTEADTASLAPASSMLYVSAAVKPEGSLRQNALTDLRMASHAKQPLAKLLQAVAGAGPLARVDFKREVEPWVGRNAGVFATSGNALADAAEAIGGALGGGSSPEALLRSAAAALLQHNGTDAALVLDTRDLDQARAFVDKVASHQGARHASYHGVAYEVAPQGAAEAIVGKFAVFGNEAGLKQAIDTHLGRRPSLTSSGTPYVTLAAKGPSQALAGIYLNPVFRPPHQATERGRAPAAGEIGQGERAAGAEAQAASLLQALPGEPMQARVSIVPQHRSFQIDADLLTPSAQAESQALGASSAAAGLLEALPEGAWLALGAGEGGAHAARYLSLTGILVSVASKSVLANLGGPALQGLFARLSAHAGALQRIFAGWNGPAAAFAAGSGLLNLQAGLEMQARSAAAAREAVGKLGALLHALGAQVASASVPGAETALSVRVQGLPVVLYLGASSERLVIGLGPQSITGALSPTGRLSSSSTYSAASSALGGAKPSAIFNVPSALALIEGLGLSESPSVAPTLADLSRFGTIAGDVQGHGGGVVRVRLIVPLQG